MEEELHIGQTLVVELEDECFVGELHFTNAARTRIELKNVFDFNTGEKVTGTPIFYKSDIKSIRPIKNDIEEENQTVPLAIGGERQLDQQKEIHLTTHELQELEMLSRNAQYICKTDRHYHEAIKDMKRQTEIALNLESCNAGRSTRTTIITICTRQNVYIFDILSLGRVFPELKEILEARKPKKILHDSRKITDNLKYRQNLELNGIFDTYVAYVAISGDKSNCCLEDCLKKFLNIPENFGFDDKSIDWNSRPIEDNQKVLTAKKTLFIYKLYDCVLHDHMLKSFYVTCEHFANVFSGNKDSVEVASDMASNKNSSVNDIEKYSIVSSNITMTALTLYIKAFMGSLFEFE